MVAIDMRQFDIPDRHADQAEQHGEGTKEPTIRPVRREEQNDHDEHDDLWIRLLIPVDRDFHKVRLEGGVLEEIAEGHRSISSSRSVIRR